MSSTLVQSLPIHPPHILYVPPRRISPLEQLAAQLAHLASQHQRSEYNCLKFGQKGAPTTYVPMSLHMPDHVRELKSRQAVSIKERCWWLSEKRVTKPRSEFPPETGSQITVTSEHDDAELKQELSAAIDSPLSKNYVRNLQFKTSETHPINISIVIPLELLPIISSHLIQLQNPSPVLYDIPPSYHLDRVTLYEYPLEPCPAIVNSVAQTVSTNMPPLPPSLLWNHATVTHALQVAMNTGLRRSFKPSGLSTPRTSSSPRPTELDIGLDALETEKSLLCSVKSPLKPLRPRKSPKSIGNMYLSSCPGKKVRLTGPVNGRIGVCRDLSRDLARVKELGVGCIVCCLDDGELEYLGVSWPEYSRIANEKGLDVLRLPTPEGLAPLEPAVLDSYLTRLIDSYTNQSIPILVHCRGGVGRAGLVACCWILKLGLCGWIDTEPSTTAMLLHQTGSGINCSIRRDTMQLVERVIGVVRRRRSVKAVETFEQVLFLVQFVEYLRERGLNSSPGGPD